MTVVLLLLLDSEAQVVSHVTATIRDHRMSFVTRRLVSVSVTQLSLHLAGDAVSASLDSGTFPTADSVSVMDMLTHVTRRLVSVSTVETTPWESSVMSAEWATMEHQSLV